MDGDFSEKLRNVLSDPEAMAKITAIASSMGVGEKSEAQKTDESSLASTEIPASNPLAALTTGFSQPSDPRLALLSSVKPLLKEEKREKVDSLLRAMTIASMMKSFRK